MIEPWMWLVLIAVVMAAVVALLLWAGRTEERDEFDSQSNDPSRTYRGEG